LQGEVRTSSLAWLVVGFSLFVDAELAVLAWHCNTWGLRPSLKACRWFKAIVGCSESQWRTRLEAESVGLCEDREAKTLISWPGCSAPFLRIVNCMTGVSYRAGRLNVVSFGALRSKLDASPVGVARSIPVTILCVPRGKGQLECWRRMVDVASLQGEPRNTGAVFQVASNFNIVEGIGQDVSPDRDGFTEKYHMDLTQGPAACLSAGPAAIARVYAPFFSSVPLSECRQTGQRQVNLLCDLSTYFPMHNGYVVLTRPLSECGSVDSERAEAAPLPELDSQLSDLADLAKVCYHEGVQVTSGFRCKRTDSLEIVEEGQCVDQVLCAALNIGQGLDGRFNRRSHQAESKARFLLRVAYEGSYMAAVNAGRRQLHLTLIGGGVFANPHEWIVDALVGAHCKWGGHPCSKLDRVFVNLYTHEHLIDPLSEKLRAHGVSVVVAAP